MRVLILGVGEAHTELHFGSSALIQAPGGFVLLDCPDPIHRVIHEATQTAGWNVDIPDIHDIIVTHLHGDHSNGLEMFGFYRRRLQSEGIPAPRLHVTQPVAARVWEKLAPSMDRAIDGNVKRTLDDFFEVHILHPDQTHTIAGLNVRCRFTGHPIPTIGLLIRDGTSTLGWSGDTPFEHAHIDWLGEANLIVHESNLGPSHTPIERLNELPESVRMRMRLIHLQDDFDPSSTDISILREGEVIDL